jgi:hypothetical protein
MPGAISFFYNRLAFNGRRSPTQLSADAQDIAQPATPLGMFIGWTSSRLGSPPAHCAKSGNDSCYFPPRVTLLAPGCDMAAIHCVHP